MLDLSLLTDEEQVEYLELQEAQEGGESLLDFVARVSPHHPPPPHFAPLAAELERARTEPIRLCVSMPPRHGKTTVIQHAFAWWLARSPADTCAYGSYSDQFAWSKSRGARALALGAGVELAEDAQSLKEWRTEEGGGLLAGGAGGGLTGQGVSGLMVVDDPFKNREEADSQTIRDKVHQWFTEVVMTRLEGASVIVCHTRWHPDDLIGRLLGEEDTEFTYLNLPALAEEDDPIGRAHGDPLWPERFSAAFLARQRKTLGAFSFDALYQGRPRPRGAKVFGPAHYYDPKLVDFTGCEAVVAADPAASTKTTANYSAGGAFMVRNGYDPASRVMYVREVIRQQTTIPQFVKDLRALQARTHDAPAAVEATGVGKAVPQVLRDVDPNIRLTEMPAEGDKFQRAQGVAAGWNDCRVLVPLGSDEEYPWRKAFLDEIAAFTGVNDAVDDQVDMLAHAWKAAGKAAPPFTRMSPELRKKVQRRI